MRRELWALMYNFHEAKTDWLRGPQHRQELRREALATIGPLVRDANRRLMQREHEHCLEIMVVPSQRHRAAAHENWRSAPECAKIVKQQRRRNRAITALLSVPPRRSVGIVKRALSRRQKK